MQNFVCKSPVLLIAFNRPGTTATVFNAIRKAEPEKLYVAVDGPREGRKEDVEAREKVLTLVKEIDWPCIVKYQISETNQGCGRAPANAITWIFENEDRAIILEDDCIPL